MDPEKNYKALEDYLKQILPEIDYAIVRKWDSYVLEPSDGLALIGEVNPGEFVATAFSGNGMTYSMIAGLLLNDLILGKSYGWKKLYHPGRIPSLYQLVKKGQDYTGELLGGAGKNLFKSIE